MIAGFVVLWRVRFVRALLRVRGEAQGVLLEEDHLMRFGFRTLCGADEVDTAYRRQRDDGLAFAELAGHDDHTGRRVNLELTL